MNPGKKLDKNPSITKIERYEEESGGLSCFLKFRNENH
jgi:hypothetical protein